MSLCGFQGSARPRSRAPVRRARTSHVYVFGRYGSCLTPPRAVHKMLQRPAVKRSPNRRMTSVFVISREPRMRSNVTEYLRERGYDTATAANYDAAMQTLGGPPYD